MISEPLTSHDHELVQLAEDTIRRRYARRRHHVAAALRSTSGEVFVGVHLDSAAIDICAEAVALGTAATRGITDFDLVVAVQLTDDSAAVLPPCGTCRELLLAFAPTARAIVLIDGQLRKASVSDLMPCSYTRARQDIWSVHGGHSGVVHTRS